MPVAPSYISVETVDGLNAYAQFERIGTLERWNTFKSALESFVAGNWYSLASDNYSIAATKTLIATNIAAEYLVAIPSLPAGRYVVKFYARQGSTPSASDPLIQSNTPEIWWNGTTLLPTINAGGNAVVDTDITLSVTPIFATVANPAGVDVDIVVTQYSAGSFSWILNDANGEPLDLSGKGVQFRGMNPRTGQVVVSYTSADEPGNIVVGGADNNTVTVTFNPTDTTAVPNALLYTIWNATDKLPLKEGKCTFKAAAPLA